MIENFGKNLARLRKKKGLTQAELAEKIGVDKRTISKIEVGANYPTFTNLEKISQFFHASPIDLFGTEKERAVADTPKILDRIDEYDNKVQRLFTIMDFLSNEEEMADFRSIQNFFIRFNKLDEYGDPVFDKNGKPAIEPSNYDKLQTLKNFKEEIDSLDVKKVNDLYKKIKYIKENSVE